MNIHTYESARKAFEDHKIAADPAEVHGMLCGLLSAGMGHTDDTWLKILSEIGNESQPYPQPAEFVLTELFNQCCQQLIEGQFALSLLIPNDDAPINTRGTALVEWVQGFLAGFGMQQNDLSKCSDEVKEAMEDFTDISRMEEPMDDDEESERALEEVVEYVRMSAMMCFGELGKSLLDDTPAPPTVH